ncbi:hypothetical protein LPJ78_002346 [Coemansia sp. RSA 989]|nr:hypothetical protein BX667DRAFT_513321 [Coemansia mojavensis]KAJ1742745.1 hypothetical protein LPJ68_001624 [Coemansia sp. RSA 1086]KAJ1751356.1 hypothetical protein LPJ79_002137 [Coemansia sp. RSA 1821]KAJ1865851.1 hypothetical protein LPJ78_002346 [Coemansia sp. RSA 989]KAJ1873104.1 hypothetical protein LPJ55_002570 [Coemansia sp. RSA 990]KAJ2669879.1 hypothetical protein IWW42_004333 [Coemansia sp. RSA 1085]
MLPSRNRVRPKKIVSSSPSVVLSSEPVLHKQPAQQKAEPKPSSAAESAKPQTTLKQNSPLSGAAQSAQSPTASAAATGYSNAENLSEQYTYVVDDNGYTWLYDTVYGQYYYYDAVQGTYIPYGTTDASNATSNYPPGSSAAAAANAHNNANGKGKHSKKRRTVRMAGGEVWEDPTLDEWPTDDYRMYASNLGPDVTSEVLRQYFGKFQSLQRTHVVCEKSTGKSRGYGFLSFGDPDDFLAAWREFNNKYVGSRPIKLGKSNWKDRNIDIRKVKRVDKRAFLEFKHRKR